MSDQAARLAELEEVVRTGGLLREDLLAQARADYRTINGLRAELARVSREAEQLREALRRIAIPLDQRSIADGYENICAVWQKVARAALAAAGDRP